MLTPIPTIIERLPNYTVEADGSWKVDMTQLRNVVLQVGTPCFGRQCSDLFLHSFSALQSQCQQEGIACSLVTEGNESLITRARNTINASHLSTPNAGHPLRATHKLWMDGDQGFYYQDIFSMLAMNLYVVGGAVPIKEIVWRQVIENVLKQANAVANKEKQGINLTEVESSGLTFAIHPVVGRKPLRQNGAVEVTRIGTGALLIKREAEEMLTLAYPERFLNNPHDHKLLPYYWNFYDSSVVNNTYLSEDYTWCDLWKWIGGACWLFESGRFDHLGAYAFRGRGVRIE